MGAFMLGKRGILDLQLVKIASDFNGAINNQ